MNKLSPVAQKAHDFYCTQAESMIAQTQIAPLKLFRHAALTRFKQLGFPSRREEDWKYTPLTGFYQTHYGYEGVAQVTEADVKRFLPPFDVMHLVFIDGYFSERFSDDLSGLPVGLTIEPVKDVLDFEAGHQVLTSHESLIESDSFGCLNSMLFDDGLMIQLNDHSVVERPILCSYIQTQNAHANHVRNRIVVGRSSQLMLIQQHVSLSDAVNAFDNLVTEIELAEQATLHQVVVQDLSEQGVYFGAQYVEQAKHSNFSTHYVGLGSALSRHQNRLAMRDDSIESNQSSACLARGKQVMDTRTHTEHQACYGLSRQLHKLVLDDQAVGVFNGMIKVARGAQKTDGQMDNKNLLLSNQAQIDSKPQLEIYADDVKCSHGSASGQISEEQIFYLRARGIGADDAKRLITQAFLLEPLETVGSDATRAWLADKLIKKLNGS
jgi:Fe-S cluster assembly protein SufD